MPSSLFADMERSGGPGGGGPVGDSALDEQRALQIALDQLSLLGLDNDHLDPLYHHQHHHDDNDPAGGGCRGPGGKKSVNMTECVPVPSSEHVAEIVGRQGCKIKALRAKTNTYIKTPVRGEEPVFVVTGRREDVAMARREIISAAEHFSMIRASRNKNASAGGANGSGGGGGGGGTPVPGPPNLPGQTTIQVRVPYRVVGLVVGPKGATIKRIQQQTHTYIVTPSRDKEPVFEVTGMPENVDRAREEIEAHIAVRTGGVVELQDENDFHANGTDVGFDLHGHACTLWSSSSKPAGGGSTTAATPRKPFSNYRNDSSSSLGSASTDSYFGNGGSRSMADYSPPSPALSYTTHGSSSNNNNGNNNNNNNVVNIRSGNGFAYSGEVISPDCAELAYDSSSSSSSPSGSPGFDPTPPPPQAPHTGLLWSSPYDGSGRATTVTPISSSSSSSSSAGGSPTAAIMFPNANASSVAMNANNGHIRRAVAPQPLPQPRLSPPPMLHGVPEQHHHHHHHALARRVARGSGDAGGVTPPTISSSLSFAMQAPSSLAPGGGAPPHHHHPHAGVPLPPLCCDSSASSTTSSSSSTSRKGSRDCSVCFESEVIAALVPCGHNLFCMECANRICERGEPRCPVCHAAVTQAIRIFS